MLDINISVTCNTTNDVFDWRGLMGGGLMGGEIDSLYVSVGSNIRLLHSKKSPRDLRHPF